MSRNSKLILFFFCVIKLALHLLADSHSGFQGDELLHIETGKHLAFGYREFPPFIGLLAFIQNLFHSQSVYVHHIFAHIAGLLILIYVAKITFALGGKEKAIFLVLLALLIAPGLGRSQQLFQPVVFSQLFWVLSFYQLVKFVKTEERKYLVYLVTFCVMGFLTKYDTLFFIAGLGSLLIFKHTRKALVKYKVWLLIIIGLIIILPNILWQYNHNFPALQMFSRLYEKQLDKISRFKNILNLVIAMNPLNLLLIIPGIIYLFKNKHQLFIRPVAFAILISFLVLSLSNGKSYYFFPIIITLLPFGAVFWEQLLSAKRKWIIYPLSLLLLAGALLIPFGMPLSSLETYLDNEYKYEKLKVPGAETPIKFDERYTKGLWKETMIALKSVYDSMPAAAQKNMLIWGKHYGQAGGINLFRKPYNLPASFSLHGSFYDWVPKGAMPATVIALRKSDVRGKDFFEPYFKEVIAVKTIYNPYADEEEQLYQTIFICHGPKQSFEGLKELFKDRIFE